MRMRTVLPQTLIMKKILYANAATGMSLSATAATATDSSIVGYSTPPSGGFGTGRFRCHRDRWRQSGVVSTTFSSPFPGKHAQQHDRDDGS
ncbi:MAG: hypothetical protein ACLT8E_08230 [Akkermansia sp.]